MSDDIIFPIYDHCLNSAYTYRMSVNDATENFGTFYFLVNMMPTSMHDVFSQEY